MPPVCHFTYLLGLGGAEKHGLSLLWQQLDDLVHFLLKTLLQDSVGLIDHQHLHVPEQEPLRVLSRRMAHRGEVRSSSERHGKGRKQYFPNPNPERNASLFLMDAFVDCRHPRNTLLSAIIASRSVRVAHVSGEYMSAIDKSHDSNGERYRCVDLSAQPQQHTCRWSRRRPGVTTSTLTPFTSRSASAANCEGDIVGGIVVVRARTARDDTLRSVPPAQKHALARKPA